MKALFLKSATSPIVMQYVEVSDDNTFTVHGTLEIALSADTKASSELFDALDKFLARNAVAYEDITRFYVASGPGSYTGARLLVTIVKTIVFLYPKIVIMDSSILDILLATSKRKNTKAGQANFAIIPARKNKYYVSSEQAGKRTADRLASTAEVEAMVNEALPCVINGQVQSAVFDITHIDETLEVEDWLAVSKKVEDVTLYEPYYLEEVNIG